MWSDGILDYAERAFQLRNQVTDLSSMVSAGGDTIHVPKVTEETAASLSSGSAVTYGANTDGKVDLSVDQHAYEAKRIGDKQENVASKFGYIGGTLSAYA